MLQLGEDDTIDFFMRVGRIETELAAEKAVIHETYRAWLGRDYQHLPLPEAVGTMRANLEAERDAARAQVTTLREALEDARPLAVSWASHYTGEYGRGVQHPCHTEILAKIAAALDAARAKSPSPQTPPTPASPPPAPSP